jgi:hypothetical protein
MICGTRCISTTHVSPLATQKILIKHWLHTVSAEMLFKSGCCPLTVGRQNLPDPSAIRSSLWDSRLTAVSTSSIELGVVCDNRLSTDSTSWIELCVVLVGWSFNILERNLLTFEFWYYLHKYFLNLAKKLKKIFIVLYSCQEIHIYIIQVGF